MTKAYKLIIINKCTGLKKKKKKKYIYIYKKVQKNKVHNTNYYSRENVPLVWLPGHPHTYTPTPTDVLSPSLYICIYIYIYTHTPLLSSTRHTQASLDPYTPFNPNQTASLVKLYRMVKTVQMADHALLRSQTAVGAKSFLFCWFCVPVFWTGTHRASSRTPHTGHAQGPLE